jgi:hypothetical protein
MNFREHVLVPPSIRIDVSIADHPELTRVIEVPRRAPAHWVLEALRLSFGAEGDDDDYDDHDEEGPSFLNLDYWDPQPQKVEVAGAPSGMTLTVTGLYSPEVGDARVSLVDTDIPEPPASGAWQTAPPPFRREHVNFELARRFGIVVPQFDESGIAEVERGIRHSSPIAQFARSLTSVRRLALRAHLDDTGVLDPTPPSAEERESATRALRALIARIGEDGVEQDEEDGWMPKTVLAGVAESLEWTDAAGGAGVGPGAALVAVARAARLVRRLRGRVVVTNAGRSLGLGEKRAFDQVSSAVCEAGRSQWSWGGQPRDASLAFLAVADGSARALIDLPDLVASGRAAFDEAYDRVAAHFESVGGSLLGGRASAGTPSALQSVSEHLAALSEPGAFGVITPAMRSIARLALL